MRIKIDGEVYEIDSVFDGGYLPVISCGGYEFYVAEGSESAGQAAARYWQDMADNDSAEFACIMGSKRLIKWGMGQSDDFGISSLQEFLERVADVPEEEFASYDGVERSVERVGKLREELGFTPTVAYRHN